MKTNVGNLMAGALIFAPIREVVTNALVLQMDFRCHQINMFASVSLSCFQSSYN